MSDFVFLQLNISLFNLIVFVARCNVIYTEVEGPSLDALDVFNESSYSKMSDCCCDVDVDDRPVGNPKRRCDEHSSKYSLSKKLRFIEPVGKSQTSEGDAC
jgi:hypothetical protein